MSINKDLTEYRELIPVQEKIISKRSPRKDIGKSRRRYISTIHNDLKCYKARANSKRVVFTLTDAEALSILAQPCVYCGSRKDPRIGTMDQCSSYDIDTCACVCNRCLHIRGKLSHEEFLAYIRKAYANIKSTLGS